ncbi:carboxylate-amine ligase [Streptomyces abikoensis]|uniref:carboxylate-amine ligase n=1 Tax=Streptomyces abikoensis TaxID=97398 RepID=UPI003406A10B
MNSPEAPSRTAAEARTTTRAPTASPQELRGELRRVRAALAAAARAEGLRLCASGTPVLADDSDTGTAGADIGDHPRYRAGFLQYRRLLDEFVLCALHAHVHLLDRETTVLVSNHLRPWLPLLVAMSANSPYHRGRDTGYAGWRAVIRGCFPCLGPPPYAASLDAYEHLASAMAATEAMPEPGMPFWDVRPNPHTLTGHVLPSSAQAQRLVDHIRPALRAYGDEDDVTAFLHRLRQHGSAAERQRARMAHERHLSAVVDGLVRETCPDGCG